jgi:hypothetical protein|tara:strand:+ start:2097 stop:2492 length:396 start_codon:yes stop_codon:yes gene_type:complete
MPVLYADTYPLKLAQLNPAMRVVYVETYEERGGDPATVQVRGLENSLPLTLRNNYSPMGYLIADTEARDKPKIDTEIQTILHHLRMGSLVCLPTVRINDELNYLEKHTPKIEQFLMQRLATVKAEFALQIT